MTVTLIGKHRSSSVLTDLRTEDSGRLGCEVYRADGERSEVLQDFAVTG